MTNEYSGPTKNSSRYFTTTCGWDMATISSKHQQPALTRTAHSASDGAFCSRQLVINFVTTSCSQSVSQRQIRTRSTSVCRIDSKVVVFRPPRIWLIGRNSEAVVNGNGGCVTWHDVTRPECLASFHESHISVCLSVVSLALSSSPSFPHTTAAVQLLQSP